MAVALVALGAGSAAHAIVGPSTEGQPPAYVPITGLLPGFGSPGGRDRGIPCEDGSWKCVDRTLERMRNLVAADGCDHKAVFIANYLVVTEAYARVARTSDGRYPGGRGHSDYFHDPVWLAREDALFAEQYFIARRLWREGRRQKVPAAWRIAFAAADERRMSGAGDLILGINAHVNNDMPFMIAATGLHDGHGNSHKRDHERFNRVLLDSFDAVLEDAARRYDPTIDDVDVPGTELDKSVIYELVGLWREGVWRNAERLESARTEAQRQAVAQSIEDYAAWQARVVEGLFRSPDGSRVRDAYCRSRL